MKKKTIVTIVVIVAVVALIIAFFAGNYNKMVKGETAVEEKQAVIQTQLQRRADLIPNFVETVKGYSDYEQSTLTAVTEARAKVGSASTPSEQASASEELDKAISVWVNAVTEAYPDLKANTQYVALQDELAGTENRIATARNDYNEAVKEFNTSIRQFPRNIVAGLFGFEKAEFFEAAAGAETVPTVSFG